MAQMAPLGSVDSGDEGNSSLPQKRISPAKYWCFTLNNYTEEQIGSIGSKIKEVCDRGGFGKEIAPTTGTPHLQGFISFKTKGRPIECFGIPEIRWFKCRGSLQQNVDYITKDDCFFTFGLPKKIKIISELYNWQKEVVEFISTPPDDRKILWVYDAEGAKGKTQLCKYLTIKHKAICLGGKAADCRNGIVDYMKNHEGITPELVVINIPRSFSSEFISYEAYENIKDMYFYSGKYEGGQVCGNSPHLVVFSNELPNFDKMTPDRWKIMDLGKLAQATPTGPTICDDELED